MKPMFDHFLFGGDWNPEQWPEDTWEHDLDMLEDAHINEVTINVFSWALLQPAEDRYDFSMLDKIVALLVKHDFNIVMATGTAALPDGWCVCIPKRSVPSRTAPVTYSEGGTTSARHRHTSVRRPVRSQRMSPNATPAHPDWSPGMCATNTVAVAAYAIATTAPKRSVRG